MLLCRLLLAAIHFNYNGNREQARGSNGEELFAVQYPRFRKGECVVRPIKEKASYGKNCFTISVIFLYSLALLP